jgi:hypothetical protein
MRKEGLKRHSVSWILFQQGTAQLFQWFTDATDAILFPWKLDSVLALVDFHEEIDVILRSERWLPDEHFVEDRSDGPEIDFGAVLVTP